MIDFAVEAQGLDAAALQERFRATLLMLGRPPNVPRRRGRAVDIDLDDIQGNVLRGYTMPAAAYLLLRIVDVAAARGADDADAAAGGDRGAVDASRPATAMNVAFTFAGLPALGLPDDVLASFPDGVPGRDGGARRAARRPRAVRAVDAWELGTGGARARQRLRRSTSSTCARRWPTIIGADAERRRGARAPAARRGAGRRARPLRLLRRDRAARGRAARASRRAPATASPTAPAAGARSRRARCCSATATRTARCPWRRSPRSTATARSSSTASWRWTRPRSGASSPRRTPTRAGRTCWRRRSSAAGPTARRSRSPPTRPDGAVSSDPVRINDFGYKDDPGGLKCPLGAHIRRANPRDDGAFFDGRLTNRHRIVRRGRAYGLPLPPRASSRTTASTAAWSSSASRPTSGASSRRSRRSGSTTATRSGSARDKDFLVGEPHGTAGQDDDPGPPAVLPEAAAALRHAARRRVPVPAVDDGAAPVD